MIGVQIVVDVVQPHSKTPTRRPALVVLAQRLTDEFSNFFEHRNTSPGAHRQEFMV